MGRDMVFPLFYAAVVWWCPSEGMECLIPTYWYPTLPVWDEFIDGVNSSGLDPRNLRIVFNINSGFLFEKDDAGDPIVNDWAWRQWKKLADRLRCELQGVKILAYVNLCSKFKTDTHLECVDAEHQGDRPLVDVRPVIDKYHAMLGSSLAGFWFDDAGQTRSHDDALLANTNYAKGLRCSSLECEAIQNPGAPPEDGGVLLEAASITVMREHYEPEADSFPHRFPGVPANKSAMILHDVPASKWSDYLAKARSKGYGHFYATVPNPGGDRWATLPPYFVDLLSGVQGTKAIVV